MLLSKQTHIYHSHPGPNAAKDEPIEAKRILLLCNEMPYLHSVNKTRSDLFTDFCDAKSTLLHMLTISLQFMFLSLASVEFIPCVTFREIYPGFVKIFKNS